MVKAQSGTQGRAKTRAERNGSENGKSNGYLDPEVEEFRQAFDVSSPIAGEMDLRDDEGKAIVPIALGLIDPTPDNARKTFDAESLKVLGSDMKRAGQDVPCKVRRNGKRFLLIDGERRFRAAKVAGLKTLDCVVTDITDEEARERGLAINLLREDLNPIERAAGYKQLLDDGRTQEAVGKLLGISQAEVSNTVRLLELPEEVRAKVAEGKVEESLARALVPHAKREAWSKALLKYAEEQDWDLGTSRDADGLVRQVYGKAFVSFPCYGDKAALAKKHRKQLDVVKVGNGRGWSGTEYITNRSLWNQLVREKNAREKANGKKSPAQQRRNEEAQRRQMYEREEQERRFRERVAEGLSAWLSAELLTIARSAEGALFRAKCLLAAACDRGGSLNGGWGQDLMLTAAQRLKFSPLWRRDSHGKQTVGRIAPLPLDRLGKFADELVCLSFEPKTLGWNTRELFDLAAAARFDWQKAWRPTKAFLELHDVDRLAELAKEWSVKLDDKKPSKAQLMDAILGLGENRRLPLPEVVLAIAKGK